MEKLKLDGVCYKYDNHFQLSNINLSVKENEITSIVGESGSGKSTLLRLISGLELGGDGKIIINNRVAFHKERKINLPPEKRNIALIFQHPSLFPNKSVLENVKFAAKDPKEAKNIAMDMLKIVGMEKYADYPPQSISGGQQQLVTLARAFTQSPDLLLLDEPFSSLDAILRVEIREKALTLIKKQNLTAIMVTHDPQEALEISDRIIVIRDGNLIMHDTPKNVFYNPPDIRTAKLFGEINFIYTKKRLNFLESAWGDITQPDKWHSSVYVRPDGIKFSNNPNSVTGIIKKILPFKKMINFTVNNSDYWMRFSGDVSVQDGDAINVELDYNYLVFL